MTSTFGNLEVAEVIVHIVPRASRGQTDAQPLQLSDAVCTLEEDARTQLETRLRLVLKDAGRQIVEDGAGTAKVPNIIRSYLEGTNSDFVSVSQELARVLRETQSGSNSDGVLLVANATLADSRAILMVKIEQEGGMRAELVESNTSRSFDMRYFPDLFFTSRSKVYKVGLFSVNEMGADSSLRGWAADKQMTGREVAVFFLSKYLGCRHRDEPEELTRRFYEQGQQWVNKSIHEPATKARYVMAIASELQSQKATLSVDGFAKSHLDIRDRDAFKEAMQDNGVPSTTFDKSTELIKSQLELVQMAFASGITLVAPRTALEGDKIRVENLDEQLSRVTIVDEMLGVKGRGKSGRAKQTNDERG
jgi:hypothetical protein